MSDTLLFLHLLSAAVVFSAVAVFTAVAVGARIEPKTVATFRILWNAGLVGLLLFGVLLALDLDTYSIWDAWIVIAIVLWLATGPIGDRLPIAYRDREGAAVPADAVRSHWIAVALVVLLLADMIWKPWAG